MRRMTFDFMNANGGDKSVLSGKTFELGRYQVIRAETNTSNGYFGIEVRDTTTNTTYVIHKGSDFDYEANDWSQNNINIALGNAVPQVSTAISFYDDLVEQNEISSDTVNAGHSLGGFLAKNVAAQRGTASYAFNSPDAGGYDEYKG